MQDRYLKVTYRKGKPFAAYLYLPRSEDTKSVRTELVGAGLIVDFGPDDEPIGLEITARVMSPVKRSTLCSPGWDNLL